MADTAKFLELFRTYESLLRDHGKEYKEIEDSTDGSLSDQLRITRQMRNYLSHSSNATFLIPSDGQIKLLEELIEKEKMTQDVLKDHLYSPAKGICTEGAEISQILKRMVQEKMIIIPVSDGTKVTGTISIHKLIKAYLDNPLAVMNKKACGTYGKSICFLPPDTPMEIVLEMAPRYQVICCTKDGMPNGKVIGVLKK